MTENTPRQIGDYEVIRELGHGGMGKVYQVRNLLSDRVEAMKLVLPDLADRNEFATRFMREIKVLASLDHPNIAALRTAFTVENQFAMVMEYVEGVTLDERLERQAFSTAEALNYIDQVLGALSYAHGKHIIHRDIKPANMMLTPQGVVKLMDFGLARSGNDVGLTVTGAAMGSLDFMSPEQVMCQPTDVRSDLYSVGVSLYQMVTRQRMFRATSSYSIMEAHVKETPRPPIELQPALPKPLNDLIMMAVAKNPAQRFQTADAFRNALAQIRASLPQPSSQAATVEGLPQGVASGPPAADLGPTRIEPTTPAPSLGPTRVEPATPFPGLGPTRVELAVPASKPPLVPARGSGSLLLVGAVVLLVVALAGAWFYKSRQHSEVAAAHVSGPISTPPVSSSPQTANPLIQDSNTSEIQTQSGAGLTKTLNAQEAPITDNAPRNSGNTRAASKDPKNSSALVPGGAAPDSQAQEQEQAAAALAQKKLLDDLETESDHLEGRAAAVEGSLDTLEQQMHRDGLGLRGDMVAARSNMRTDLAKAKQAMDSADTDRARHYLDLAHREVEKLEAFLGRR